MPVPDIDRFPLKLAQLISTTASVINEHVNDQGLYAICGSVRPCERAVVAEHNLGAF